MNDRQRLQAIVAVVCKYLPPDGISREQAINEIIGLVDPLPEQPKQKPVCNKDPKLCGFVQCQLGKVCKHTAQLEQEPYCWVQSKLSQGMFYKEKPKRIHTIPLYTAPLKREWVGLTDDEIKKIMQRWRNGYIDIKDAEQLLKDKNI